MKCNYIQCPKNGPHASAGAEESSGDPGRLRGKWAQRPRRRHTIGLDHGLYRILFGACCAGQILTSQVDLVLHHCGSKDLFSAQVDSRSQMRTKIGQS